MRSAGSVFAEDEARLMIAESASNAELAAMIERRCTGEPLQQILGWAEFAGHRIWIAPGVFVPRRRTEFLMLQAVAYTQRGDVVLDMCCGAGPIGAALLALRSGVELHCVDIDPVAAECATRNLSGYNASVYVGNLFEPLPRLLRKRVDVLVANAPYVPSSAIELMPAEARKYEERATLDGGEDGLDVQRLIAEEATKWLTADGVLLFETSESQAAQTIAICEDSGLKARLEQSEEYEANVVVASVK